MIQFNLLPDVKQEYIKAKRQKHSVIIISLLTAAGSLFIFVMLFLTVHVFQKFHLNSLNDSIQTNTKKLQDVTDLNKILTIQNQLDSLPKLHDQKPVTSRLFGFLGQITPAQVSIGKVDVDYGTKTINLTGTADSLGTVNKFVDTIKFTTYNEGDQPASDKPFSSVVLASFSLTDKDATYQITLSFNEAIFDSSKNITLVVPKIISTRSETEKPTDLFKALPETKKL